VTPQDIYRSKLINADEAVSAIGSGMDVAMGMAVAEPPALLQALSKRIETERLAELRLCLSKVERDLIAKLGSDAIEFVPVAFSQSSRVLSEEVELDACITTVSPMDRNGWFTFGTSNDYTSTAARRARRLIVEVNPNMPRVFGDSLLHISEVDAIVENATPLPEISCGVPSEAELAIARTIAGMIDDGACLQTGIGTLPMAVCGLLEDRKDLGIHTELLTPALARLIECGAVTNKAKATYQGRSVFTFAMGNRAFYDFIDDNPSIHSLPVQVVNDPRHIAKNDNVISINGTLQVDLGGACNSEHLLGRQYSGSGGQLDFVRGAAASRGGKSIIACQSTACGGEVSRIVPSLTGPVTTPRNDTHIIVTEFGWADMKGKSLRQRAEALIELAHPKFRAELEQELKSN
jgi:itaconate CoA-transferase